MADRTRALTHLARRWLFWLPAVRRRVCVLEQAHPDKRWCRRACPGGDCW